MTKYYFLVSLIFLFFLPESHGQKNMAEKVVADYKKFKDKSEELKEKERQLLSTVYKITRKQRKLALQKAGLLEKREILESDIAGLQKNILNVSDDIKKTKKQIVTRLKSLQRVNAPTLFQSIFGAQDVMEMDRSARVLYRISKSDVEQLRAYQGLKNLLFQQQETLRLKLADFEKNQKLLDDQEQNQKNAYIAKMDLLKKLNNEDKKILMTLKRIRENSKNQIAQMEDLTIALDGGVFEQKGKLPLPVVGILTHKFGVFNLLNEKIKIYNKGWFLSTGPEKEVKSIFKGRVVFSGFIADQNQVVVIDHGDHYYSVYSNLKDVLISKDQDVVADQNIGKVAASRFFGHGLYVEIRHFSQPEDPLEWFRDEGINISSIKEQNI